MNIYKAASSYCWIVVILLGLIACEFDSSRSKVPMLEDWQVERVCCLYLTRNYEELIEEFDSYRNRPEKERQQLITLFRNHAAKCDSSCSYPNDIVYLRSQAYPGDTIIDVYVEAHYPDERKEEVVFTMIYVDGDWYVR